jgi:hypothetical protein
MQYIRNMILVAVFGWVSMSCNPSEPPPPPPAPLRPAVSSNLPADAQSPSGSGLKPVAGNSGGSVNAGPLANSSGSLTGGQSSTPNVAGAFSAITGLIQSISSGGGIDSIGTSIQNLIASFAGGATGGGALSGFGNLLSGLIPGLGGASSTPPSP